MAASAGDRRGLAPRPGASAPGLLRALVIVGLVGALLAAGLFLRGGRDGVPGGTGPLATPSAQPSAAPSGGAGADVAPFLLPSATPAPPLDLVDPDGTPFSLAALRGELVLVFFGYTHCPDVCPATTGIIGEALRAYGAGVRAVFVTVDPERDTPDWLRDYVRFLPRGFGVLTGTPGDIRSVADAWGVRYAKVDTGDPEAYTISHTADDAGDIRRVTTDPVPDRRLSSESTVTALAAGRPYVLVLDSYRFKATAACGRALLVAKYLVDRWPGVAFIHHEPYRYDLITDTPVLQGSLTAPVLTDVAVAWGLDARPWGPLSMPWVFVVDAGGSVRAVFQGVLGSDDLDVMISLVAVGG